LVSWTKLVIKYSPPDLHS